MLDLKPKKALNARNFPNTEEVGVNKSELITAVAGSAALEKRQAERAVDAVVQTVMSEVKAGRKVSLIGFGSFNPTSRAARTGRNPRTGAPVRIAASKGVRFSVGSGFKSALNSRAGGVKKAAKKTTKASSKTTKKATKATKSAKKR
jgi:DNA-binding protein HU-beta